MGISALIYPGGEDAFDVSSIGGIRQRLAQSLDLVRFGVTFFAHLLRHPMRIRTSIVAGLILGMASYDRLSRSMADHNDLLILRTFSSLNIKNLLYYEAELATLECELQEIELEDHACKSAPRQSYAANWKALSTGPEVYSFASTSSSRSPREALQWELFCRIRSVLKEYNDVLISYAQIRGMLQKPRPEHLVNLRKWLERPNYGCSFLRGKVESVWDAEKGFKDFASFPDQHVASKGFTSYLTKGMLHVQRKWTARKQPSDHIYTIRDETQQWIASGVMTVLSSVFPVLPIVILFFVKRLLVRLVLILVFTALFATTLVFGMRMEPDKTLAITTAQVFSRDGHHRG